MPKIFGSQSGIRIYVHGYTGSTFFPVVRGTWKRSHDEEIAICIMHINKTLGEFGTL